MPLTDVLLRNIKPIDKVQKISDGEGLYLHVSQTGGKLWRMAYRYAGKQKTLSFGAYPAVSLKEARKRRDEAKELLAAGVDPNVEKKRVKAQLLAREKEATNTFALVAEEWFVKYSVSLSERHAKRLRYYLNQRVLPIIGKKPLTECEPDDFLAIVAKAEKAGHYEIARKLMRLCGQVMGYAQITGKVKYNVVSGLTKILPSAPVKHLAAITEPKEIAQLLRDIDNYEGHFAVVYYLKILPYVFTRPSELRLAQWSEIDWDERLWKIPATRMKMRRSHTVPLASQVLELLHGLKSVSRVSKFLFPSIRSNTATISDAAPLAALRRLGYTKEETCLHGFRSTASTRLNELGYRADVIESQLAHKDSDSVRLAYNRAEYLEERRKMMQSWADYLDGLRAEAGLPAV